MIHSEDGKSVVPPQFINISRRLSRQVQSHLSTVTGAPGKAYTEKPSARDSRNVFNAIRLCASHHPATLCQVGMHLLLFDLRLSIYL